MSIGPPTAGSWTPVFDATATPVRGPLGYTRGLAVVSPGVVASQHDSEGEEAAGPTPHAGTTPLLVALMAAGLGGGAAWMVQRRRNSTARLATPVDWQSSASAAVGVTHQGSPTYEPESSRQLDSGVWRSASAPRAAVRFSAPDFSATQGPAQVPSQTSDRPAAISRPPSYADHTSPSAPPALAHAPLRRPVIHDHAAVQDAVDPMWPMHLLVNTRPLEVRCVQAKCWRDTPLPVGEVQRLLGLETSFTTWLPVRGSSRA